MARRLARAKPGPPRAVASAMTEDEELPFDFGLWCQVCGRQIDPATMEGVREDDEDHFEPEELREDPLHESPRNTPPDTPRAADIAAAAAAAAAAHGHKKQHKKKPRKKVLHHQHHPHLGAHRKAPVAPAADDDDFVDISEDETAPASTLKPSKQDIDRFGSESAARKAQSLLQQGRAPKHSTLYCSDECEKVDEARSKMRLASLNAAASPALPKSRSLSDMPPEESPSTHPMRLPRSNSPLAEAEEAIALPVSAARKSRSGSGIARRLSSVFGSHGNMHSPANPAASSFGSDLHRRNLLRTGGLTALSKIDPDSDVDTSDSDSSSNMLSIATRRRLPISPDPLSQSQPKDQAPSYSEKPHADRRDSSYLDSGLPTITPATPHRAQTPTDTLDSHPNEAPPDFDFEWLQEQRRKKLSALDDFTRTPVSTPSESGFDSSSNVSSSETPGTSIASDERHHGSSLSLSDVSDWDDPHDMPSKPSNIARLLGRESPSTDSDGSQSAKPPPSRNANRKHRGSNLSRTLSNPIGSGKKKNAQAPTHGSHSALSSLAPLRTLTPLTGAEDLPLPRTKSYDSNVQTSGVRRSASDVSEHAAAPAPESPEPASRGASVLTAQNAFAVNEKLRKYGLEQWSHLLQLQDHLNRTSPVLTQPRPFPEPRRPRSLLETSAELAPHREASSPHVLSPIPSSNSMTPHPRPAPALISRSVDESNMKLMHEGSQQMDRNPSTPSLSNLTAAGAFVDLNSAESKLGVLDHALGRLSRVHSSPHCLPHPSLHDAVAADRASRVSPDPPPHPMASVSTSKLSPTPELLSQSQLPTPRASPHARRSLFYLG